MEHRISTTELAHTLGEVLGQVSEHGDSFVIERDGLRLARVVPVPERSMTLREFHDGWRAVMGPPSPELAEVLESVNRASYPLDEPWVS